MIVRSYFPLSADQPADGLARLERAGGVYVAEHGIITLGADGLHENRCARWPSSSVYLRRLR